MDRSGLSVLNFIGVQGSRNLFHGVGAGNAGLQLRGFGADLPAPFRDWASGYEPASGAGVHVALGGDAAIHDVGRGVDVGRCAHNAGIYLHHLADDSTVTFGDAGEMAGLRAAVGIGVVAEPIAAIGTAVYGGLYRVEGAWSG